MFKPLIIVVAVIAAVLPARAGEEIAESICAGAALAADAATEGRQYAPDRAADILHVALDVTPDFKARTVAGRETIRFAPIAKPLRELRLDAVRLRVASVEASVPIQGWQNTDEEIVVTFANEIAPGAETTLTIAWSAEPKQGLYFRTPEMGYREEDEHVWSQGEPTEARHWFPCFDAPNEKFTSEVTGHVPDGMVVLSNGRIAEETFDAASRTRTTRWVQEKPMSGYLIAFCAGKFKRIEGRHRDVPLEFYTPASQIDHAANSFRETADIMKFYEGEIGVPYPWAKYAQVVVDDFTWGGMENTSLTVLTDRTLFTDATENLRSSRGLVAHEMAHQWFGDYVTCKDWSQLWLNEGFATFYAHLYEAAARPPDEALYGFYNDARRIFDGKDERPIALRVFKQPVEQFGPRAYEKGSWVLRMLRARLGEELYRRCIRTYLERHALGNVTSEDLRAAIEGLSGLPMDRFFDQWVYHGGFPELEIAYAWDEKTKLAKISVKQTQSTNEKVALFDLPAKVRFKRTQGEAYAIDGEAKIDAREGDFYFALPSAPEIVRFDPDYSLLAKVNFTPPGDLPFAQLKDESDPVGRLLAVEALKSRKDKESVGRLKEALNADPSFAVRIEASKALREIRTDDAYDALAASLAQPDARARRQVVADVAAFYRPEALDAALAVARDERNPGIVATAIEALGKWRDADATARLAEALESDSYRNELADSAIQAIRAQDDPAALPRLTKLLGEREDKFTSWGFGRGLDSVGWLARNEEKKDSAREFLAARLAHPKRVVKLAAIGALATLRDPRALPALQALAGPDADDPVQRAAADAVKKLNETKPPPVELGDLRGEVTDLKKDNDKLRKDIEDLKKRFDARNEGDKK